MTDERGAQRVEHSGRLGGGNSARLIAVGVVAVLAAFIAIGVLGRQPAPAPQVVAEASPTLPVATPRRAPIQTPYASVIDQIYPDPQSPRPYQFLGTVLRVADQGFIASLEEVAVGRYEAEYRVPFEPLDQEASIELAEMTATTSHDTWETIGRWDMTLEPIRADAVAPTELLRARQPALPNFGHELRRRGFEITVATEARGDLGVMTVKVRRMEPLPYPAEVYAVDVRAGAFATRVSLVDLEQGQWSGTLTIPDEVDAEYIDLALVAMPEPNALLQMVTVHSMVTQLLPPEEFREGQHLAVVSPPRAIEPSQAQLLAYGHEFSAETVDSGPLRQFVFHLLVYGIDVNDGGFADMNVPWPPRIVRPPIINRDE